MVNQLFLRSNYRTLAIQSKERLVHQSQAYAGGALSGRVRALAGSGCQF